LLTRCVPTSTTPTGSDRNHLGRKPDMTTDGIEAVFLETHNWGKAAKEQCLRPVDLPGRAERRGCTFPVIES
jgi:hypothetical protein